MLKQIGVALGLIALCALSILRTVRPPSPVPASAPDTVFSAERAMRHVEQIAQRPHPPGSTDHDRVRDYVVAQLTALGLRPQMQASYCDRHALPRGRASPEHHGSSSRNRAKGKAVLLMAHYDGVEAGPAAADDGAGSAAMLETLRALRARKQPLRTTSSPCSPTAKKPACSAPPHSCASIRGPRTSPSRSTSRRAAPPDVLSCSRPAPATSTSHGCSARPQCVGRLRHRGHLSHASERHGSLRARRAWSSCTQLRVR